MTTQPPLHREEREAARRAREEARRTRGARQRARARDVAVARQEAKDLQRAQRAAVRKEEMVAAGLRVIRRDGAATSMEGVAAEAGVTKPIVYRHLGDRAALVEAVGSRWVADLQASLATAMTGAAGTRATLSAGIDAYLAQIEADPGVYEFLVSPTGVDEADRTSGVIAAIAQSIALMIGERMRELNLDSGCAEPWGYGIVGMVHASGHWWLGHRTMSRATMVTYLTGLAWGGLAALDDLTTAPGGDH